MLSTRTILFAFTGACIAASLGGAIAFTHATREAHCPMPPGGLHGAPRPTQFGAAQQTAYHLAQNAWNDPEN